MMIDKLYSTYHDMMVFIEVKQNFEKLHRVTDLKGW